MIRKLGLFSTTNIVVANMIGAGIFTTSGLLLADLGSPVLMLALWVAGGFLALMGALCYGELGAAMPRAGGEYAFLSQLYHPMAGFLSGWISFIVGFSAPVAASAIGFSAYLQAAWPSLFQTGFVGEVVMQKFFSILIILIFSAIHLRGISFGAKVQNVLTLFKIIIIAGLIMAGFAWGDGNPDHFRQGTTPVNFDWSGWKTIGLSLMWITFAYSGWNASTYIGAEIKKPEWTLPRSLVLGTGIVSVLYLFINMLFVWSTPPEALSGVVSVGDVAVSNLFGRSMGDVVSVMITVALLSSISAFIILGPRVYYAMAVDGYFFRFAARLHPKSQAPVWSIVMQAGISIVIILSGTLDQVLTYMGFSLGIFPLLTIAGLFKLRASGKSKIRLPGFPFTAVIYLIIGLGILLLSFFERPVESSVAIGTVVLGVPFYFLFRKSKG